MLKTFLLLVLALLSVTGIAQSDSDREEYVIGFSIAGLEKISPGKWLITLDQGANVGFKQGASGEVWGILRPEVEKHNVKLGVAHLTTVTPHEAKAEIETDSPIFQGDLVFLSATLSLIANPSPYFRLVQFGIRVTDQNGTPFYTSDEVFKRDGYPFRTEQFLKMKAEINRSGIQFKQKGDTATVEAGPNRGRKVWEVMEMTDTLQVWFYVYHLWKMNDETMGQTIKLADGYFAYAREGDAATLVILKNLFLDNPKETWDQKFEQYRRKLPADWASGRKEEALELTKKGEYDDAHKLHDISLFIARKYSDDAVVADCVFGEAETFALEKKYNEAADGFSRARDLCVKLNNELAMVRCDVKIGYALKNAGRTDEALKIYQRGEKLMQDLIRKGNQPDYDAQLYRVNSALADLHLLMRNYAAARATHRANRELAVRIKWTAAEAESDWGIAISWENEKKYAESVPYFEQSAKLYLATQDTTDALDAFEAKAKALENMLEYQKAITAFQVALPLAAGPSAKLMKAKLLKGQGRVLRKAGNMSEALKALEMARLVCVDLDDKSSQSSVLREIGEVYQDQKNFDKAVAVNLSRLPLLQDQPVTAQADVYWNIAYMFAEVSKDYKSAINYYRKSVELYSLSADTSDWKTVLCNLAAAYRLDNDSVNAYKTHQVAIDLTLGNSDPENLSSAYEKAADSYGYFKNYDKKIELLKKGLAYYQKLGDKSKCGEWNKSIADTYVENLKDYSTANKYFLESINCFNQSGDPATRGNAYWGYAYHLGQTQKNYQGAIANYKNSIALYSQTTDTSSWKTVLSNLAIMYQNIEDSVNAYKFHQLAIELTKKNSDPSNLMFVYQKAAETYDHFKNYQKRIELLKKGLHYYETTADHVKIGEWSKLVGKGYEEGFKDFKTADKYYLQAIEHYDKTNELIPRGRAYWAYAYNIGQNEKRDAEAIPIYEIAYKLYIQGKDSSNASVVRSNIGQSYWSLNNFDKAIEAHKEAINLAVGSGNQEQIFSSWNSLASLYKSTQNPVAGAEALKNAADAVERLSDSTLMASTYYDLAGTYSKSKDYLKAVQYYEKTLTIRMMRRDSTNIATTLGSLGGVYQNKNDYARAKDYYLKSLDLRRRMKDKIGSVYTLADLGNITSSVDADYRKAESYFMEAIAIAKQYKDDWALAFCYDRLNYLYRAEGKSGMAVQYKRMTEAIYRKNKNWKDLAELTIFKGFDAFYYAGDQNKGMQILDSAQSMLDTLKDKTVQAELYNVRASILREMGEFDQALDFTDKSMALYNEVDNGWGILGSYVVKGNIYKQRGEYETALKYQFKADSMFHLFNNEYSRYVTFSNIGENYVAQGDYPKALEYFHKANAIFVKSNDLNEDVASLQGMIGVSYFYENNFTEAEKWLNQSLASCERAGAFRSKMENLSHLGRLNIAQKKYDEAFKHLSEGLTLSKEKANKLNYLNNLVLMGKLEVERKNYEKAKDPLEESVRTSKAIGKNGTLWESLYLLGILYKNTGDLAKSKDYLKEAVSVIEKLRNNVSGGADAQKLFSSNKNILNVYDALIEVLLAQGETEEAMTYLQKNNEDNLKSKFKALDMKFESQSKNRAVAEERDKKARIDGIEAQISREKLLANEKQNTEKLKNLEGIRTIAENEYLKFINQQINVQPELSKFFNNSVQPTQFRKIKKQIPKDMALISYLAGENQLYIFAATTDTVIAKIVTVPREQLTRDINAMINIVRSSMGTFAAITMQTDLAERTEIVIDMKQTDKSIKPFEDAYHYLIAPVSKEIAGKSRLCIIPTGSLNYIPFQLLGKTLTNGKFSLMMNQFSIFYANSTDMLFREKSDDDKKYHILAFGNPDSSLPSTEKEVNDIKRMYPNASIFLRDDATEDKAKYASESFNVMHFATHGNLDYEDFSKSYLTMAGNAAKSEDGKLTLEELWGMEVMNHLNIVVLSACQTAVTKGSNESSPVSPASGFLQNGVKSVVATLWKVDDEATSILMSDFYNNIKTMDAVDALRASQTKLSGNKKFNHPYYWAAFVLMGDWR